MAELTFAAVSLSFQLFSGCIQGYQLLSDAIDLPKEYRYVRIRFKNEQFRLLDFACVAQISECDDWRVVGRAGKAMLIDVLEQQHNLLYRFGRYDDRLKPITRPLLSETIDDGTAATDHEPDSQQVRFPASAELLRKALHYVRATRKVPTRLRWAVWDKKNVDILLEKLTSLNDFLTEILNKEQADRLFELQTRTYYGVMQLNSTVGQLLSIFQAERSKLSSECVESSRGISFRTLQSPPQIGAASPSATPGSKLAPLARVKALNVAIHDGALTDPIAGDLGLKDSAATSGPCELDVKNLQEVETIPVQPSELEDYRTEAKYYDKASGTYVSVWVEWKFESLVKNKSPVISRSGTGISFGVGSETLAVHSGVGPDNTTDDTATDSNGRWRTDRLNALVTLLRHSTNTGLFRAARCLGYLRNDVSSEDTIKGTQDFRYGFVFEKPPGSDSTRGVSLLELLSQGQQRPDLTPPGRNACPAFGRPSVSDRVALSLALVEGIERLHVVNWLHKGFRSHNVLFFAKEPGCNVNWHEPVISGFELSRPESEPKWTAPAWSNPAHDLYKHPHMQNDPLCDPQKKGTETFKKLYDIYALGVVLVEISCWSPVHVILNIDLQDASTKDTMKVAKRLQEAKVLQDIRFSMGDTVCEVIQACLGGLDWPASPGPKGGRDPDYDFRLQEQFYTRIVQKLRSIRI